MKRAQKNNLQAELEHRILIVVKSSKEEWNDWLSRIAISGGSEQQQIRFYTDLFHDSLQGRRTVSDVDGRYSDQTSPGQENQANPPKSPSTSHFNSDSFWGRSGLYRRYGRWFIPKWPRIFQTPC